MKALLITLALLLPMRPVEIGTSRTDVWLLRGWFGQVYSTGLDTLSHRLSEEGHRTHVLPWHAAGHALRDIRRNAPDRVALVCHSFGCVGAFWLARRLEGEGRKVCLIASIDPAGSPLAPANVKRALAWRQGAFGPVRPGPGFAGRLVNYDMTGTPHIELDDARHIHDAIAAILAAGC